MAEGSATVNHSSNSKFVNCQLGDEWYKLTKKTCLKVQKDLISNEYIKSGSNNNDNSVRSSDSAYDEQEWGTTIKLDEHISVSKFGADSHMATVEELNNAMNNYRQIRNLPNITIDQKLCEIAQIRAENQSENGGLDNHAGFDSQFQSQDKFYQMGEVLFGGSQPVTATHIVEWGWDQSLTGHKEAISDPSWTDGCGGVSGYFAVFIFGRK